MFWLQDRNTGTLVTEFVRRTLLPQTHLTNHTVCYVVGATNSMSAESTVGHCLLPGIYTAIAIGPNESQKRRLHYPKCEWVRTT